MKKVLAWCARRGVAVEFDTGTSCYWTNSRAIYLKAGLKGRNLLYTLLHECGHHLIETSKKGAATTADGDARLVETRIGVLQEEMEAWGRGRKLASRLGVRVDNEAWRRLRTRSLSSYLTWAVKPT